MGKKSIYALSIVLSIASIYGGYKSFNAYKSDGLSTMILDDCVLAQAQGNEPEDYIYELVLSRCYWQATEYEHYNCPRCPDDGTYCPHVVRFKMLGTATYEGTEARCSSGNIWLSCSPSSEHNCN